MRDSATKGRRTTRPSRGSKMVEFERELSDIVQSSVKSVSDKVRQILAAHIGEPKKETDLSA